MRNVKYLHHREDIKNVYKNRLINKKMWMQNSFSRKNMNY